MKVGDRVQTPEGTGTVHRIWSDSSWSFRRLHKMGRVSVRLDPPDQGWIVVYSPADLTILDRERAT